MDHLDEVPTKSVPKRTAAATAARRRGKEERLAKELQERGWLTVPPKWKDATDQEVETMFRLWREVGI